MKPAKAVSIKVAEIQPNPNNPRVIKDEKYQKLVQSLKQFPEMLNLRPLVLDENKMILGGNMRYAAAVELGYKELPCLIAEGLSEEQKREFILKDNVSYGDWDWDALLNNFTADELNDFAIEVPDWANLNPQEVEISLPDTEKSAYEQITFTFTNKQAADVKEAVAAAKKKITATMIDEVGNDNSNGNALWIIAQEYLSEKTNDGV